MNREIKKLVTNTFSLIIVQGGNYIIPLLTFPFLVRTFGVESYGIIAYSMAIVQYFTIFSGFGLNLYAPRELAISNKDQNTINDIFSSVFTIKVLLLLLSFIILLSLITLVPAFVEYKFILLTAFTVVVAQTLSPVWFFQGVEEMKWITVINLSSKFAYAIALFSIINDQSNIIWVPFINGLSQLGSAILGLFLIFTKFNVRFHFPKYVQLIEVVKGSLPFFMSRISVSLYTVSNTFFLGTFGTMEMTGIYAMAEKLFTALQGAYHPLVNALYPYISRNRDIKLFKKIFYYTSVANVFFVGIIFLLSNIIFQFLFKEYLIESVNAFKVLLIIALGVPLSILLGYPLLGAFGHTKYTNFSVVFSSIFHITSLTILAIIDKVTVFNVIYTLMFTEFFVLLIRSWGVKKYNLWQ